MTSTKPQRKSSTKELKQEISMLKKINEDLYSDRGILSVKITHLKKEIDNLYGDVAAVYNDLRNGYYTHAQSKAMRILNKKLDRYLDGRE